MSLSWRSVRQVVAVIGLGLAIAFLPQVAWAGESVGGVSLGLAPAVESASAAAMTLDQAQSLAYSTGPTLVEVEPGQFAFIVVALAVLVALVAASLVLGMRR